MARLVDAYNSYLKGLGVTFMMLPLMTLTLNTVDENEVASAAGLQSFMRTIATAVATSIPLSYWGDTQRLARSDAVAVLQPEAAQASLAGLGFPPDQVRQVLSDPEENQDWALRLRVDLDASRHQGSLVLQLLSLENE